MAKTFDNLFPTGKTDTEGFLILRVLLSLPDEVMEVAKIVDKSYFRRPIHRHAFELRGASDVRLIALPGIEFGISGNTELTGKTHKFHTV